MSRHQKDGTQGIAVRLKKDWIENGGAYLLALAVLAYYLLFHYKPMVGAVIAFKDFSSSKGISGSKWIGVRYFSELTNMACLTEEVGELARIMARRYGDQSFKEGESHDPSEEMADILWVLICLANQTGVDLTDALQKSFEKKTMRDKNRHKNNPKLKA